MKSKSDMTPEEFKRLLEEKGVEEGQWQDIGGVEFEPGFMKRNRALMQKLKGILEASVEKDREEIGRLKQKLKRLQYGGGGE